ncbi:hypothetical protein Q9314_02555 [Shinella sumterensis]|uniref:Uncharacterized protein n=1 Tax=Rhizobium subbaraonis TaxID=908946 RepID=A0A285URQ5_9HYPH|nr:MULTISPECIES: hypothetical protein [Rhizobiaceae]MCW5712273.1 hypothetical protein [Shinella sp.]WLS08685.1 hypothetical protein Q9314_02555 [Shinella sumterensis]SOC44595.1 hypothetical protein SAMN05892877_1138 [Rhizobium subbaraonis]
MAMVLNIDCLEAIASSLAGREWSKAYIPVIASSEGNGVVSGASEHFSALRLLARVELGDIPLPSRFCAPSAFDD